MNRAGPHARAHGLCYAASAATGRILKAPFHLQSASSTGRESLLEGLVPLAFPKREDTRRIIASRKRRKAEELARARRKRRKDPYDFSGGANRFQSTAKSRFQKRKDPYDFSRGKSISSQYGL